MGWDQLKYFSAGVAVRKFDQVEQLVADRVMAVGAFGANTAESVGSRPFEYLFSTAAAEHGVVSEVRTQPYAQGRAEDATRNAATCAGLSPHIQSWDTVGS